MAAFGNRHRKRKLKNEINVVPYIDVMLVLLVIFMITSSVMNLGVVVHLPQSNVRPVEPAQDPVVVSIDGSGQYFLRLGEGANQPVTADELTVKIRALMAENPQAPVFVAADRDLRYQAVMDVMERLQGAGVARAALLSVPNATEP